MFLAEMNYCGPHGIPYSFFVGYTKRPVWDDVSRHAAILWQQYKGEFCTGCGTHPDDYKRDKGGDPKYWQAKLKTCYGCGAIEVEQRKLQNVEDVTPGTTVELRRNAQIPDRRVDA